MASVKCELGCSVTVLGEGKSRKSLIVLKFGSVVLGSGTFGGVWDWSGVQRDIRTNGFPDSRWKLNENGKVVLRSLGYKV